jgi:hypothetical protein
LRVPAFVFSGSERRESRRVILKHFSMDSGARDQMVLDSYY